MSVTINYDKRAASTEAFAILAEAWNELTIDGITPDGAGAPPYGPDAEVLYAVSGDGDIVGVLTWEGTEELVDLKLAYVEPSSRESGVFRELFQALKERVYARGVRRITCSVPAAASKVMKALSSVGCAPASISYEIKVG
jgi:GNAT superfamily N-acetyltransferase